MRISPSYFLKVFFRVKTSDVEKMVIEKWYNRWFDLLTGMLLLGPDLHCVGPLHFGDFCNIFLLNIGEDQNVSPSELRAPGTVPYGKSCPGYSMMFIKKVRRDPDVATFRTKTLNFTQVIHVIG